MHSDNQLIRKIKKKNDRGAADKLLGRYYREINRIHFESNLEDTFLLQMIDYYRESLKEGPGSFGVAGEDVQETIREEYGSGYSQNYINRMTELCTRQEISLLLFFLAGLKTVTFLDVILSMNPVTLWYSCRVWSMENDPALCFPGSEAVSLLIQFLTAGILLAGSWKRFQKRDVVYSFSIK